MTTDELAAIIATAPAEDPIQHHDRTDEMDEHFQDGIHACAARCCTPANSPLAPR